MTIPRTRSMESSRGRGSAGRMTPSSRGGDVDCSTSVAMVMVYNLPAATPRRDHHGTVRQAWPTVATIGGTALGWGPARVIPPRVEDGYPIPADQYWSELTMSPPLRVP